MTSHGTGIVVDLATDPSDSAVTQLVSAIRDRWQSLNIAVTQQQQPESRSQQERLQSEIDSEQSNAENRSPQLLESIQKKTACNGTQLFVVVTLLNPDTKDVKPLPLASSKTIVSEDCVELLFKAKTYLDEDPGFGCEVQVVTSLPMKKFWEAVCIQLFSPVTTWSVWGVDIEGQAVTVKAPAHVGDVEDLVKAYLKTLGDPGDINLLRSPLIPEDRFNAGFHERYGGVSQLGPLASMNMVYTLRKPDPVVVVKENRRRLAQAAGFDPEEMHVTKAEHDRRIWVVGQEKPDRYDGIVTDRPGVTVCAAGADCCMILLADTRTGAVGAVHAGWKGTAVAAVRALLHTMVREYGTQPQHIRAAIGPCVSGRHFLLLPEDAQPITDLDPTLTWPSKEKPHLVHVDLVRANVLIMQREGVLEHNIDTSYALCTFENPQFFSYERGGIPFGNQLGFISRRPPVPVDHQ